MYGKIYDYIIDIDIREKEYFFKDMQEFIIDYQNGFESCKELGKRLEKLAEESKKLEELEDIEDFLWEKIYQK